MHAWYSYEFYSTVIVRMEEPGNGLSVAVYVNNVCSEEETCATSDVTVNDEVAGNEQSTPSTTRGHKIRKRICRCISLLLVILLVVGVMQIPITLYFTDQSDHNITISGLVLLQSCSVNQFFVYYLFVCMVICLNIYKGRAFFVLT